MRAVYSVDAQEHFWEATRAPDSATVTCTQKTELPVQKEPSQLEGRERRGQRMPTFASGFLNAEGTSGSQPVILWSQKILVQELMQYTQNLKSEHANSLACERAFFLHLKNEVP